MTAAAVSAKEQRNEKHRNNFNTCIGYTIIKRMRLYGNDDALIAFLIHDFKRSKAVIGPIDRLFQLVVVSLIEAVTR